MPLLRYLADTNAISDWLRGVAPVVEWFEAHHNETAISALTLAEMRGGIERKPIGKSRRALEQSFNSILEKFEGRIWVFDEAAAFEWGRLAAAAANQPLPYDDSLIGAIARSMGATVVTRNHKDFPGCHTVDPWTGEERSPRLDKSNR
jgi:toxin FitB